MENQEFIKVIDKIDRYRKIRDRYAYTQLLRSGMFFEFYPELTGNWEIDKEKIN